MSVLNIGYYQEEFNMKNAQIKELVAYRRLQEIMLFVIIITFLAYHLGGISRMATHLFWLIEAVIYFMADFIIERVFNRA